MEHIDPPLAEDPLAESWQIQEEASSLGFDWPDISGVFSKVREEIAEIEEAWQDGDREHAKRELGDALFALVNLGRFLSANPAEELHRTNHRFLRRFASLKAELHEEGRTVGDCSLAELDEVWERVKQKMRAQHPGA